MQYINSFHDSIFIQLILFTIVIYLWLKYKYSYWQRHKLPFLRPFPFFGSLKDLIFLRTSFGSLFRSLHASEEISNVPIAGFYILHKPALIVRDPDLIKLVLIKNFNLFLNRYEAADPFHDSMGSLTLPLSKYPIWRESRKRMSEFFTSGRLKEVLYPKMLEVARALESFIARRCENSSIIEVKEMCALFTTDLTGLLSYGINPLGLKNGESDLHRQSHDLLQPNFWKAFQFFTIFFLPKMTSILRAKVFTKKYSDFWRTQVNDILNKRIQKSNQEGDLLDILQNFKQNSSEAHSFANHPDFIASQACIFLLAGFETSSSVIAFTLYELAKQPYLQHKLRLEINESFQQEGHESLSYSTINEMSYLGMVVCEALRLYPAAAFINRECTPGADGLGFSLKPYVNFVIPSGMPAYISILGLHRDPKYWPNPEHFDPERFTPAALKDMHPMTYIPFGAGPHGCIGSRLGQLQVKLGLVHILREYKVETCAKTVKKIVFDPGSFMLQAKGGIFLNFVKRSVIDA